MHKEHDHITPRELMEAGMSLEDAQETLDRSGAEPMIGETTLRFKLPTDTEPVPRWIVENGVRSENPEWTNAEYQQAIFTPEMLAQYKADGEPPLLGDYLEQLRFKCHGLRNPLTPQSQTSATPPEA